VTVGAALALAATRLRGAGVGDPDLDAELLLRHVLGWDRAAILTRGRDTLAAGHESRFLALVEERARRRPLQHLTGTQAFWRHEFVVGPAVLVPRPETEVLVEAALGLLAGVAAPRVIDVGTGSGCIGLSLAAERPDAIVVATDLSADALAIARENASRLGVAGRVRLVRGDLVDAFGPGPVFDLVASNPPYVDASEWSDLAPEVRDHDPRSALVPGNDEGVAGLYRRLLAGAARVLRPGGSVVVEVGAGQGAAVAEQAAEAGLSNAHALRDLQGIPRVIVATAPPTNGRRP
jgi:release factor glutamine methyltransferase